MFRKSCPSIHITVFRCIVFSLPYCVNSEFRFLIQNSRKEIEPFLPPLKPDYCVKQAMKAILTDQPMICTPRLMYIVTFMKR